MSFASLGEGWLGIEPVNRIPQNHLTQKQIGRIRGSSRAPFQPGEQRQVIKKEEKDRNYGIKNHVETNPLRSAWRGAVIQPQIALVEKNARLETPV